MRRWGTQRLSSHWKYLGGQVWLSVCTTIKGFNITMTEWIARTLSSPSSPSPPPPPPGVIACVHNNRRFRSTIMNKQITHTLSSPSFSSGPLSFPPFLTPPLSLSPPSSLSCSPPSLPPPLFSPPSLTPPLSLSHPSSSLSCSPPSLPPPLFPPLYPPPLSLSPSPSLPPPLSPLPPLSPPPHSLCPPPSLPHPSLTSVQSLGQLGSKVKTLTTEIALIRSIPAVVVSVTLEKEADAQSIVALELSAAARLVRWNNPSIRMPIIFTLKVPLFSIATHDNTIFVKLFWIWTALNSCFSS